MSSAIRSMLNTAIIGLITSAVAVFYTGKLLDGAFVFIAISIFSAIIFSVKNWSMVQKEMNINSTVVFSWLVFIGGTILIAYLGRFIEIPWGASLVCSGLVCLYLWWTYYALEPARN
jgi:hypothetical protein